MVTWDKKNEIYKSVIYVSLTPLSYRIAFYGLILCTFILIASKNWLIKKIKLEKVSNFLFSENNLTSSILLFQEPNSDDISCATFYLNDLIIYNRGSQMIACKSILACYLFFYKKSFHWNTVTPLHLYIVCGCIRTAKAEFSSCGRHSGPQSPYYLLCSHFQKKEYKL